MLQVLFNLHYPPVSKQLVEEMLGTCEDELNNKEAIKKQTFSPFHDPASTSTRRTSTDTPRGGSKSKVSRDFLNIHNFGLKNMFL